MMKFIAHASGSAGNLYQVISDDRSLIIDPGIPIAKIKRALGFKLSAVSGALISHSHADHSKAVHSLAKFGLKCWMTKPTATALKFNGHCLGLIEPLKQFQIANFTIVAISTQHDCPGSVGFLISDGIDKLLFATDTFYIHNRFAGVNIIAIECNYSQTTLSRTLNPVRKKRLYKSHFSLENVKKFLAANDLSMVREIHLIHMSKENADPRWFKSEIQRLTGVQTITNF
jgi:phosphoribosyl 1,2-cyclic phosphodiesterase